MSKPMAILRLLKDAFILPLRSGKLMISITLLLLTYNLLLTAIDVLNPLFLELDLTPFIHHTTDTMPTHKVDLAVEVLWWLSSTVGTSLLSIAYIGNPSTLAKLLHMARQRWKPIFITSLITTILSYTYITLVLVVGGSFVIVLGGVGFMFVQLVCQLSIVISAAEDGGGQYGLGALRRAGELLGRWKFAGFCLSSLVLLVEQVLMGLCSDEGGLTKTTVFVKIPGEFLLQIFACSALAVFYLECRELGNVEVEKSLV